MTNILDHSARHVWDECRRKYYWQYIRQLQPGASIDLARGGAVHRGLEKWYQTRNAREALSVAKMPREPGLLAQEEVLLNEVDLAIEELLLGYFKKYETEEFEVVALEKSLAHTLPNGWVYLGVIDAVLKHQVLGLLNKEAKSTKQIPTDWVAKFQMDAQSIGYVWLSRKNKIPVWGTLLDLLRMTKYPDYVREPIPAPQWLVDEWEQEILTVTDEIAYREGLVIDGIDPMAAYPKNTDACFKYNKECPFRKICIYGKDRKVIINAFYTEKESPTREEKILAEATKEGA